MARHRAEDSRRAEREAMAAARSAEARAAKAEAAAEARVAEAVAEALEAAAAEAAETRAVGPLRDALVCPLTMELFADPVCTSDGQTYERAAIEQAWNAAREMAETCGEGCSAAGAAGAVPEPFVRRSPCTG